jgi:pimeloyl-[acyl-carrier protein] methyl ester esterase
MSLYVETLGSGPDLVMIHGWGMHGGVWQPVRDTLSQHFRLHLVDLPGFGHSADTSNRTVAGLAQAVAEIAPDSCRVCGWSLGGQVALQWALARPQQVQRLVLVSTTPKFIQTDDWQPAISLPVFHQFADSIQADYQPGMLRFLSLQAQGGESTREIIRDLREHFFRRPAPSPLALAAGLDMLLYSDMRAQAVALSMPTLVIHGERDRIAPPDAGRWLATHIPHARLALQGKASHAPFLSHPAWFKQQLTGFCHEQH